MANLSITRLIPEEDKTGVYLDQKITVFFNLTLDPATVDTSTFLVYPTASLIPIVGDVVYSAENKAIIFYPKRILSEETEYAITLVGSDSRGNYIQSKDGDPLVGNYTFNFTTGTSLTPVEEHPIQILPSDPGAIPEYLEIVPSGIPDDLKLIGIYPEQRATNLDPNSVTEIVATFNQNLASGVDYRDWISLYEEFVDGMDPSGSYINGTIVASGNKLYFRIPGD